MTPDRPTPEAERAGAPEGDQARLPVGYGHGRMPGFMKVVWIVFLAFATWYVVAYLVPAAGDELAR